MFEFYSFLWSHVSYMYCTCIVIISGQGMDLFPEGAEMHTENYAWDWVFI